MTIDTTYLDEDSDKIKLARPALLATAQQVNTHIVTIADHESRIDALESVGATDAVDVSYTPAGTGAAVRNVQAKLREVVSAKDFGAVGDGVADDTAAIQAFLSSDKPKHFGNLTYRITSQISVTATQTFTWESSGAKIVVDSASPIESAIKIELNGFDASLKGLLDIDCQNDAYAGLLVINTPSVFVTCEIDGPVIRNVYRSGTAFNYGDGIYVFGAYQRVVIRNFEIHSVKMATGAGVPFSYGVSGVSVIRYNNSTRDAEFVLIEDFFIDKVYSEDVTYGARDQDGVRVLQAYEKSQAATYPNPVFTVVRGGRIKNAHGRAVKMVSEYGTVKDIQVVRDTTIYSGFKSTSSEDFDFQVSGGSMAGIRCYYDGNCPDSVATFIVSLVDGRRSPTKVDVQDVIVSTFGAVTPTRLIDIDVLTAPLPANVMVNVSSVQISGAVVQVDEIIRLRNQNNIPTASLLYNVLMTSISARVNSRFVWRDNETIDNTTSVTAVNCLKTNPTNVPLVTGTLTTNIFSSLVGLNLRLT